MNRERDLAGSNGYDRELRMNPVTVLCQRIAQIGKARWLDLCCGSGRALLQAVEALSAQGLAEQVEIVGVDLVEMYWHTEVSACLKLVTTSVHDWEPEGRFDLITCVLGLHYLGDKLKLIERAAGWPRKGDCLPISTWPICATRKIVLWVGRSRPCSARTGSSTIVVTTLSTVRDPMRFACPSSTSVQTIPPGQTAPASQRCIRTFASNEPRTIKRTVCQTVLRVGTRFPVA
jgi:trans-aconitate methyltransferase